MTDRLRLQVWTPLPPQRTGVADHNAALLEELAKIAEISVVVDDDLAGRVQAPDGVALVRRSEAEHRRDALAVYHMGNHHGLHRWIHDALVARPGIVVLHDPSLVDFYAAYHDGSPDGFDDEIRLNHGRLGHPPPRILAGGAWHFDRLALPLVRRVVEPSLAVIVHSAWARDLLARQFPHKPIHHVELAAPVVGDRRSGPDMRNRLGWGPENVVFGMLGGLWWHKRPDLGVKIFAALHPLRPWARLLVAGRAEDRDAMERMLRVVSAAGLGSAVRIVTDLDDEEFTACVSACDVVMDLRWPTAGETSATVMRALGAGRPAIVSDLPQYRALDRAFCWPVPPEPREAAPAALRLMLAAARDPGRARHAGRLARRFVEEAASFERVARRYEEVARSVPPAAPPGVAVPDSGDGPPADVDLRVVDGGRTVAVVRTDDPGWDGWRALAGAADETWVPSRFLGRTAAAAGVSAVAVVPWVVDAPLPPGSWRADDGVPHDAVVFLTTVTAGSPVDVQNPFAVVEAFARAFDRPDRGPAARLVVLAEHLVDATVRSALRAALAPVGGVLAEWERGLGDAYARRLLGAADVYVSLHRATGFGRAIAEAMYLGKPVIATAYSGNVDFMTPADSCLVGYSLTSEGADPDLDQAARWMRVLCSDPARRRRLGAAAAAAIRRHYGRAAALSG